MLKRHWPTLLTVVVGIGIAAALLWPRSVRVDAVACVEGPVSQTVVASGRVASPARILVSSQVAARIESISVREGDRVSAGQLLGRLRSAEAEAGLTAARAALDEAQGRLMQLTDIAGPVAGQQTVQAELALALAEQESGRVNALFARGFVAQARVDEAARAREAAYAAARAARLQSQAYAEDGIERLLARWRVEQAQANVAAAKARLDLLVLRAPADATVLTRLAEPGDTAQIGRTLLELAQSGDTRIIATVDEKNLRLLAVDQQASVLADAFPEQPFKARINFVAPSVDLQRGTVEIRLTVTDPPGFLRPDMTVSVEMAVGRRDATRLLPADAVRGQDTGSPWVLIAQQGRAVARPVTLGLRGVGSIEILDGLVPGDQAILPGVRVEPGDRVAPAVRARERGVTGLQQMPGLTN